MKRLLISIAVISIVILLIFCGCSSPAATSTPAKTSTSAVTSTTATQAATSTTAASTTSTQVINLKFNTSFPSSHMFYKMDQYFVDQIAERTSGRVKITLFPAGTLTDGPNVYTGVVTGISDIGEAIPAYTAGRFTATDSLGLPLAAKNGWVFTHVANDFQQQFKPKENNDVHVLFEDAGSPYVFQTRDKAILTPSDLQGLKVRASGAVASKYVTLLGGVPMGIPMTEAYDAASKGAIDAVLGAMDTLKSSKLADVFHYVTIPPTPVTSAVIYVMNSDRWNALPTDIQDIFTQVSEEMVEAYARAWYYSEIDGQEYFSSQSGVREIHEIPAAEAATWNDLVAPVITNYITTQTAAGLPAADYVKYNQERVEYWNSKIVDKETVKQFISGTILK